MVEALAADKVVRICVFAIFYCFRELQYHSSVKLVEAVVVQESHAVLGGPHLRLLGAMLIVNGCLTAFTQDALIGLLAKHAGVEEVLPVVV